MLAKIKSVFVGEFLSSYTDHVESVWPSDLILVYSVHSRRQSETCKMGSMMDLSFCIESWTYDTGNLDDFVWSNERIDAKHCMSVETFAPKKRRLSFCADIMNLASART